LTTSLNLVAAGARAAAGLRDFLGHVLFGDRFDFFVGVGGVVHRAVGRLAVGVAIRLGRDGGVLRGHIGGDIGFVVEVDHIHARGAGGDRIGVNGGFGARPVLRFRAAAAVVVVFFLFLGAGKGTLFLEQGFAVGDRDLVVIGVDLGKGQKAVAVAAVVDEGGLQRGLDPRHLGQIDVSGQLALVQGFKIELFDLVSVHHDDAGFFRMGGVDKHFLGHVFPLRPKRMDPPGGPDGRA